MQTVFRLTPITQEATSWIEENVHSEPWQRMGDSLAIEHRYAANIFAGLIEAGLLPNKDFRIS